ncbi:MAG: tetratricopeptide repeat protein [Rhodospirillales bacterium]|nr:tetratricopeptide repeat protein [Rhodospirillales bacterium]MCB9996410.1 tetratricopeptide repeat protein [Rhodospirillales bacterium]
MLRALFFAIKIGLIFAAAVWIAQRPGEVELDWLGYHIKADVGLVLLGLFALLLATLVLHRMVLAVAALPTKLKKRHEHKQHDKGYQSLTQGLTAVAAGDAKLATAQADKTRALWPDDKGLSLLLEAQAARLRGEEDVARAAFDKLLHNKDTAFLGLRGLLVNALERGDTARGLELAHKAQKMHPRQPWILQMVYDLEIQEKQWDKAEHSLRQAIKFKAVEAARGDKDRIAMLAAQADELNEKGDASRAIAALRKAHKIDPGFAPVAQRLAALYIARKNKPAARKIIEATWRVSPHPDLVPLWDSIVPQGKAKDISARLNWFEKLVLLKPDSAEGQLAAAKVAMEEELWGQARDYLSQAEKTDYSARLCRLYATLEERLGHTEEANGWLEKAADAPAEKVWTCKETGRIYERWDPVARPHGSFNTIIWDYPKARASLSVPSALPQNELLITAK